MRLAALVDIFQWDVRNWSRALPLWNRYLMHPPGRPALAIGERDGGLSLLLAQRGYLVMCTDLNGPSQRARDLHRSQGVEESVNYGAQDATALASPDAAFDVVMFKSVIGAMGTKQRRRYLRLPADRDMFQAFARVDLGTTGFVANLGRSERQRDLLGRVDGVLMPLIPASWRYIVYGAAVKNK